MLAIYLVYTIGSCCQQESAIDSVRLAMAKQISANNESRNRGKCLQQEVWESIFRLYKSIPKTKRRPGALLRERKRQNSYWMRLFRVGASGTKIKTLGQSESRPCNDSCV